MDNKCNEIPFPSLSQRDQLLTQKVFQKLSSSSSSSSPSSNHEESRILCVVHTYHANIERARAIDTTWGKDCDKIVFMTDIDEFRLSNSIKIEHPGLESYSTMAIKLWSILKRVIEELSEGFDWIYVCGDDTFLMVEHLRQYLKTLPTNGEALYIGRRFQYGPTRTSWRDGLVFNSGSGYVLNKEALKLWYVSLLHLSQEHIHTHTYSLDSLDSHIKV